MDFSYKSWNLSNVPQGERKAFIVKCLSEYIADVETIIDRDDPTGYDAEIIEIAELYKEIIHQLQIKG